tara:strand:- start:100 stop:306 length:207 start_codon:yes stop_codon:yes gene_type:complete
MKKILKYLTIPTVLITAIIFVAKCDGTKKASNNITTYKSTGSKYDEGSPQDLIHKSHPLFPKNTVDDE